MTEDYQISVIVNDYLGNRYELYVNPDDPVQTILDKYKLELIKNVKWPVNENEYKYILRINGKHKNIDDLSKIITDVGIKYESTLIINIQKNINEELLFKINEINEKLLQLENCCNEFKKFEIKLRRWGSVIDRHVLQQPTKPVSYVTPIGSSKRSSKRPGYIPPSLPTTSLHNMLDGKKSGKKSKK